MSLDDFMNYMFLKRDDPDVDDVIVLVSYIRKENDINVCHRVKKILFHSRIKDNPIPFFWSDDWYKEASNIVVFSWSWLHDINSLEFVRVI